MKDDMERVDGLKSAKETVTNAGLSWTKKMQVLFDSIWVPEVTVKFQVALTEDSLFRYLKESKVIKLIHKNIKNIYGLSGPTSPVVLDLKARGTKPTDGCILSLYLKPRVGEGHLVGIFDPKTLTWKIKTATGLAAEITIKDPEAVADSKFTAIARSLFDAALGKAKMLKRDKVIEDLRKELHSLVPSMRENLIAFGDDFDLKEVSDVLEKNGWARRSSIKETVDGMHTTRYRYTRGDNTIFLRNGGKKQSSLYRGLTIERAPT
jgi:hypothetical protein